jgi:hypothetical protein
MIFEYIWENITYVFRCLQKDRKHLYMQTEYKELTEYDTSDYTFIINKQPT